MKPLSHLVMLDLTHMLSGPFATMVLADLGVRTIKVEPPGKGEATRRLLADSADYAVDGMGAYFLTLGRNKESICLDLKADEGREVFYALAEKADIVFDNFSPGVTERLGIGHETLATRNPRIVTCSVTGFGQTGPGRNRTAFDMVAQGMGGGMSITGTTESGPMRAGIPIGDLVERRRVPHQVVRDAGESRHGRRDRATGIHERRELADHLSPAHLHRGDLRPPIPLPGGGTGRLDVDHDVVERGGRRGGSAGMVPGDPPSGALLRLHRGPLHPRVPVQQLPHHPLRELPRGSPDPEHATGQLACRTRPPLEQLEGPVPERRVWGEA